MLPNLPSGFTAAGIAAGLKPSGDRDLALIVAERRCSAAGVFTQNLFAAAPVQWSRLHVPSDRVRAIVINAGNANAATGAQGLENAKLIAELAAQAIGCEPDQVLVASTGVIGRQLPMNAVASGIPRAATELASTPEAFQNAAHAIMTTDTHPKVVSRTLVLAKQEITLYGFCKGAAMIGPNMATMLAFVLTDARVGPGLLQGMLAQAVDDSFNCISVEGHTSTNDTVIALALDGGGAPLDGDELKAFGRELTALCTHLARLIVDDAEGCTHTITIEVEGCQTRDEADRIAKTIAHDALVKTAICGADPNWGRIVSAAGRAGVPFDIGEVTLWLNGIALYQDGAPLEFDAKQLSDSIRAARDVSLRLRLRRGDASIRHWTSDLTAEYVRLNADYTT